MAHDPAEPIFSDESNRPHQDPFLDALLAFPSERQPGILLSTHAHEATGAAQSLTSQHWSAGAFIGVMSGAVVVMLVGGGPRSTATRDAETPVADVLASGTQAELLMPQLDEEGDPSAPPSDLRARDRRHELDEPPRREPTIYRGSLTVRSEPSGASVFVNGRSVGRTPLVLPAERVGSRAVKIDLNEYQPWTSAVSIVADTNTNVFASLRRSLVTMP